jgi:hypothetical protein
MAPHLELKAIFEALGVEHVYFQPPESSKIQYPCIIFQRDDERTANANNRQYNRKVRYKVTVIDKNPASDIPAKVSALPLCSFDRFYTADKLNHDVYNLFF